MTFKMLNPTLLGLLALVAATTLVAAAAADGHLGDFLRTYEEAHTTMDPKLREIAEFFGSAVGNNRRYRYELKLVPVLYPNAELGPLLHYLEAFKQLRQAGDADALIDTIKFADPQVTDAELADGKRVAELAEAKVAPACRDFVLSLMRPLFDSAELAEAVASGRLEQEIRTQGARQEVRDFLFGWAHYHACSLLVLGDQSAFFSKTARRSGDYANVRARIAARS